MDKHYLSAVRPLSDPPPSVLGMEQLTDDEQAILDFEGGGWWNYDDSKETAIRQRFDCSLTRYYQLLARARGRAWPACSSSTRSRRRRRATSGVSPVTAETLARSDDQPVRTPSTRGSRDFGP